MTADLRVAPVAENFGTAFAFAVLNPPKHGDGEVIVRNLVPRRPSTGQFATRLRFQSRPKALSRFSVTPSCLIFTSVSTPSALERWKLAYLNGPSHRRLPLAARYSPKRLAADGLWLKFLLYN